MGVKRPERVADHSPPSSAEVKNAWGYTSTPQSAFKAWYLVKHRDFTFTLYLEGTDHFGSLGVDGRIILKWISKKQNVRMWTEFNALKARSSGGLL
jgi:hypothetical protein